MSFPPPNVPTNPMLPHAVQQPAMYPPMPPFPMAMRPGAPGQPMPPPGAAMMPLVPPGVPLPMPPPPMGMMPVPPPGSQPIISAPPSNKDPKVFEHVRIPLSAADMKVATTVFVGNISDKASDTLVRQILLRCGSIEGWKRVQDASGKLQAFGFCEYANPESTLRALRLLHDLKLGEKALVVKVDANTRKDLLKYLTRTKMTKNQESFSDEDIDKAVAELEEKNEGTSALTEVFDTEMQEADTTVKEAINSLLRDHVAVLSSNKSSEDVKREHDVKESILFMAKQSGKLDPDSTLDDMDMEDDMKTLVSDEIKRFRQSYQKDEEQYGKKSRESRRERERDRDRERERDRDKEREKDKDKEDKDKTREQNGEQKDRDRKSSRRDRSRSPQIRPRSPRQRSRSPLRSRSQERREREKRREAQRLKELEESAKEEEEYEERQRHRRLREKEKAYRDNLASWESRERRKQKEHDKDFKREEERREEMEREKKHLAEFLEEYDDDKDDHKYYRGSAYARRRREREMEIDDDERDRLKEKDELETLRLQVMERQARKKLAKGRGRDPDESSSGEDSPQRMDDEDDVDVPVKVETEDIPLTKPGYTVPSAYPPIQVQSAPAVQAPEIKDHPREKSSGNGITIEPLTHNREEALKREVTSANGSPASTDSPQTSTTKLSFGFRKSSSSAGPSASSSSGVPDAKKSKLDAIFSGMDDEAEEKPKKKLVPIEYSDEEGDQNSEAHSQKRKSHSTTSSKSLSEAVEEKKLSAEERKKLTQELVNSIPTVKEEVFQYQLKWEQIDKSLIDKRVGPWINKKINEYIGEEEPVLTEFICNKLACHISPEAILSDIAMVLDDEAEVFVVKLWRLLIYETEAKHLGIAKSY